MSQIPADIAATVKLRFPNPTEQQIVFYSLHKLWRGGLNVPPAQLARAIVFLSDGDLARFIGLRESFLGDPRDLLVHANSMQDDKDYWFGSALSDDVRPTQT